MSTRDEYLPQLVSACQDLARRAATHPRHVTFKTADYGGLRTEADTTQILRYRDADYQAYVAALKRSNPNAVPVTIARFRPILAFGSSLHNYAAARDLEPTSIDGVDVHISPTRAKIWSTEPKRAQQLYDAALDVLGSLAPAAGLRWGGKFSNPDRPHFELPIGLDEAKRLYTLWRNPPTSSSSSGSSTLSAPQVGKVAPPAPQGSALPDRGSGGQPGGSSTLWVLGSIAAAGFGYLVYRAVRGY